MAIARDRQSRVNRLASTRWGLLVAAARRAGAGADAEDAVQDVLGRLAAGAGAVPDDDERLVAYATVAVRRRAYELSGRRTREVEERDGADEGTDHAVDHERRRALRAYLRATAELPERARAVVVLDAAGWSRGDVAARLRISERAVRRELEDHRGVVLAAAARALDGSDCARLAGTLEAYGAGRGRPRPGGPVARHLEVCDGCRAGLAATRRARVHLRALFPPPVAFGITGVPTPAVLAPLFAKGALAALIAAATVGGGAFAVPAPPVAPPAPRLVHVIDVRLTLAGLDPKAGLAFLGPAASDLRGAARRARKRVKVVDPYTRRVPPGGCDLGTLGVCGLGGGQ
jgi:RNA polymerase sigma factor (sigma-70 family)